MADPMRSVADMVVVVDANTEKLQRNFNDAVKLVDQSARKIASNVNVFDGGITRQIDSIGRVQQAFNKYTRIVGEVIGSVQALDEIITSTLKDEVGFAAADEYAKLKESVVDLSGAVGGMLKESLVDAGWAIIDASRNALGFQQASGTAKQGTLDWAAALRAARAGLDDLRARMISDEDVTQLRGRDLDKLEAQIEASIKGGQRSKEQVQALADATGGMLSFLAVYYERSNLKLEEHRDRIRAMKAEIDALPRGLAPDFAASFRDTVVFDSLNEKLKSLAADARRVGMSAPDLEAFNAQLHFMNELDRRQIQISPLIREELSKRVEQIRALAVANDAARKAEEKRKEQESRERQLAEQSAKATEALEREVEGLERKNAAIGDTSRETRVLLEVERTLDARRAAGLSITEKEIDLARRRAELLIDGQRAEGILSERTATFNATASEISRSITGAAGTAFRDYVNGVDLDSKRLSDILKKLAQDLQSLIMQKLVLDQIGKLMTAGLSGGLNTLFSGGSGGLAAAGAAQGATSDLGGFFGSLFSGRAKGGPVEAGVPYWVGERGREIFVPNHSGSIVPNDRALAMGSGGSPANVQVNVINNADGTRVDHRSGDRGGVRFEEIIISTVSKGLATGELDAPMAGRYGVARQTTLR